MNERRDDYSRSSNDDNAMEERQFQKLLKKHTDLKVELHYNQERQQKMKSDLMQWKSKVSELKEDCRQLKSKCDPISHGTDSKQKDNTRAGSNQRATMSIENDTECGEDQLNAMPMEYRHLKGSDLLCLYDFMRHYKIVATNTRNGKPMAFSCRYVHQTPIYWHANQMTAQFPDKYCKLSALCQVTREFADRGKMELAEKLYDKIWEDADGFFELK